MKEPQKRPLNPNTPRSKSVPLIKMPPSDNIETDIDTTYKPLNNNENNTESDKT